MSSLMTDVARLPVEYLWWVIACGETNLMKSEFSKFMLKEISSKSVSGGRTSSCRALRWLLGRHSVLVQGFCPLAY